MHIKNKVQMLLSKICSMEYYVVLKFDMQKMLQISYFHFESFLLLFTVVWDSFCKGIIVITSQISRSVNWLRGSRLVRTVPRKRTGSWGMIQSLKRRSWRPMVVISMPSTKILPPAGSTNLNNALISVVLPLPVRPTTPTLRPPSNRHVIFFNTSGEWGR